MTIDLARAWTDEAYLQSLTDEQRAQLPENPIGLPQFSLANAGPDDDKDTTGTGGDTGVVATRPTWTGLLSGRGESVRNHSEAVAATPN